MRPDNLKIIMGHVAHDHTHLRVGCRLQLTLDIAYFRLTKFEDSSFSRSRDTMPPNEIGSRDPDHAHLGLFVFPRLIPDIGYLCIKFDHSSFTVPEIMIGAPRITRTHQEMS